MIDNNIINQVVIVGGGTAGWLTAAKLAKKLNSKAEQAVQVTLIESPDIPTIGVGEGTWPTMRKTLAELDIDESEFMRFCHASFKQATKFVNWQTSPQQTSPKQTRQTSPAQHNEMVAQDNAYYHLFSSVVNADEFNLSPYWLLSDKQQSYADFVSPQAQICQQKLAPKTMLNKPYEGLVNYAYHLDAGKFADFLKQICCQKLGVHFISANVTNVELDQQGLISAVVTDSAGRIAGDFFVDCSGFKCLLLGETYGVKFKPINDILFTDHAIAIQVPYEREDETVNSETISTAQSAGWIWDIGLSNRRGTGFVYCADFISHDDAEQTLRHYIGEQAEPLNCKKIKMNCGYREEFFHGNCVAIGLSAAFVEPLEASAIFLIEASANMLCEQFPRHKSLLAHSAQKFNQSFHYRWQKTIDFIKLHYYLSKRTEDFWLANKAENSIPETLKAQIDSWRYQPVSQYDFPHVFEPFLQDSYQYVLHGMGFEQNIHYNASAYAQQQLADSIAMKNKKLTENLLAKLPSNRQLLMQLKQHSFQPL